MYLKELTINGFKSFAKKGELAFQAPITAIVGPNGSGKSNVAEAFRFVLGEQSIKSLRGKKGEDLIFNGSDNTSRGNRAHVSVLLDNKARVFSVDFDEIVIERIVHRDGQNEYVINGSKVRLKDVQEILASANIGSTGHHIISQGEADRILSASPKDRREMIEDALGLKVFQYKKIESEKKLKKTLENIERVQSLRREVAPHLQFLQRQVNKIERAVKLKEELRTSYIEYLKREDVYLAYTYTQLTKQRKEPAEKLEVIRKKVQDAKRVLSENVSDTQNTALISLEERLSKTRQTKQELLRKSGQHEGQISFLQRRIEQLQQKSTNNTEVQIPLASVKTVAVTIEQSIQKGLQQNDAQSLKRILSDITHTLQRFMQSASGVQALSTESEEKELHSIKIAQRSVEQEIASISVTESELQHEYDLLKKTIEANQSESRQAQQIAFDLIGEQRECENTLTHIDQHLQVIERDRDEFKRELQEAVVLIGRAASEYFSHAIIQGNTTLTEPQIANEDRGKQHDRRRELEKMKIRLEELGGGNDDVIKEFNEVKERDAFLVREIEDLESSLSTLQDLIDDLTAQLNERFIEGIETIASEFNRFFVLMFGGGEAKIVRTKPRNIKKEENDDFSEDDTSEEVIEEGIELEVKLPNKRVNGLGMLSGGERALTSIALIFAMSQVNPPLFIILDETDAALDEANSRRYGDMIEALAQKSQLILITHNRETMARAGVLYGVTMGADGISKLLSVQLDEAIAVAK